MCAAAKSREKFTKSPIFYFKVVQGYRCYTSGKVVSCYEAVSLQMNLSATVFVQDWSTVAEIVRFEGITQI